MTIEELEKLAARLRVSILESNFKAQGGFTGGLMSAVEIMTTLYFADLNGAAVARMDAANPGSDEKDYVILSKAHCAILQYAMLAEKGFFDKEELNFVGTRGSILKKYPSVKVPGVCASITSRGMGLSVGCGVAMSLKSERKNNRVFVVLGDGELKSGGSWEAVESASRYKLDNLIVFVDMNSLQSSGEQEKLDAFGWNVIPVSDGHDFDKILDALARAFTSNRRPVCILCRTVSGKGVEFAERKAFYHDSNLSAAEMNEVIPKIKAKFE